MFPYLGCIIWSGIARTQGRYVFSSITFTLASASCQNNSSSQFPEGLPLSCRFPVRNVSTSCFASWAPVLHKGFSESLLPSNSSDKPNDLNTPKVLFMEYPISAGLENLKDKTTALEGRDCRASSWSPYYLGELLHPSDFTFSLGTELTVRRAALDKRLQRLILSLRNPTLIWYTGHNGECQLRTDVTRLLKHRPDCLGLPLSVSSQTTAPLLLWES